MPLPRRQELPEEAFVSLSELKSFGSPVAGGGLPICVVSAPWLTSDHPDPRRTSLRQLTWMLRHLVGNGQRWAVFWDFFSLHQRPEKGKRDAEEELLYERSKRYMGLLYSHPATTVCRITRLPDDYPDGWTLATSANIASYDRRAWCFLEWQWSRFPGKPAHRSLDLGRLSGEEEDRKAAVALATSEAEAEATSQGNGRLVPPLTPEQFVEAADVMSFSLPKDDGTFVPALYDATFKMQLGKLRRLDYSNCGMDDEEAEQLGRVMAHGALSKLELLYLDGNRIGEDGFAALALAIANGGCPKLTRCVVERNPASGDSVLRAMRRLHEQLAAGVKPTAASSADANPPTQPVEEAAAETSNGPRRSKERLIGGRYGMQEKASSADAAAPSAEEEAPIGPGAKLFAAVLAQRRKSLEAAAR